VSSHEHERLSAYLDGELPAGEREEVAQHLAACAECAARLAEFAAVGDAAATLAAGAPSGYFEALPGRVRARLEPRAAHRLPVWGWAVAAALLLAVVTPLTLRRLPAPESTSAGRPAPAAAPPAAEPVPLQSAATPAPPQGAADERVAAERLQAETGRGASPAAPKAAARRADARKDQASKGEEGFAGAPFDSDHEQPATGRLLPGRPERRALDERDARARENAVAPDAAAAPAEQKTAAAAPEAQAKAALAAPPSAGARIEERVAAASTPLTDDEWRRLAAARPQSAEEWRRLREGLRRFAETAPEGPHAPAARLRTIEAGHSAWQASRDPDDEAVFRADAEVYLQRDDARDADKARVRRLLR
jgi:anti-sigma factor RsiW